MEPRKRWRIGHNWLEGRMLRGSPQNPRSDSQPGGPPHPGGGQPRGADREDLAKRLATHQHRRSALELHTPRLREGRGQDSRWYRHQKGGPLRALRPHQDEDTGAGSDRSEEVEGSEEPPGDSLRAGHRPQIQGECRAHCS
jgi:hypothetical protein